MSQPSSYIASTRNGAAASVAALDLSQDVYGSVWSFPQRGPYGRSSYPGNCSGYVQRNLIRYYRPKSVCDPLCGSDTTGDVVAELNREGHSIRYDGLDLHSHFNIIRDSLIERLKRPVDYVFLHPPYHSIVPYSGAVWGTAPHPDDLSRCSSYDEFLSKLQVALNNVYQAVRRGGAYSILIGDIRRDGKYFSPQADIIQIAPGSLEGVIIKLQHETTSGRRSYGGRFIPISHEYLINMRADVLLMGLFDAACAASERLKRLSNFTWRALVEKALAGLGGRASLSEIYAAIEREPRTRDAQHWKPKVRQQLYTHPERFAPVGRGVWELAG